MTVGANRHRRSVSLPFFAAQWCLNAIMVLDFIRDAMPETAKERNAVVAGENVGLHQA